MSKNHFKSTYDKSWALVVGVNEYQRAPSLDYACNDATVVGQTLIDAFGFPDENVIRLLDSDATKANILEAFLSFENQTNEDDRLFFFFAGHGHTKASVRRGQVGYLVPVEGDCNSLSTLIRWDELTRNADLIPAKHVFFVMDACYGGLAITRSLGSGSTRFLKDMLQRFSRQVLTAGKANETVADSGGPIAGHSIFTGHFLEGIGGNAASDDGIITANGVMSYVYEKVSKDQYSRQSPHYGFVDGDGDFIFNPPVNDTEKENSKKDTDILVAVPPGISDGSEDEVAATTKQLLSDPKFTIQLHDNIVRGVRNAAAILASDRFPNSGQFGLDEFLERLTGYENAVDTLTVELACLAHWGQESHKGLISKAFQRLTDHIESAGGNSAWLCLRWYPMLHLMYSSGIAAISGRRYDTLNELLLCQVEHRQEQQSLVVSISEEMLEATRMNLFKKIPGKERNYVPRSEYLHQRIQPAIEDLFFLGKSYELAFDRFEIFVALSYMDSHRMSWAPVGRFGWKEREPRGKIGPVSALISEAASQQSAWPPLKAGFFSGSYERFQEVSSELLKFIGRLGWH